MLRNPLSLKRYLYVLVHAGTGNPYAFQVNVQRISAILLMTALTFFLTTAGSLLFFRELELNRKLQEQLLDLETRDKLAQTLVVIPKVAVPAAVAPKAAPAPIAAAHPAAVTGSGDFAAGEEEEEVDRPATVSGSSTAGRISELNVECAKGNCAVKMALMTTGANTAEGQLLIVLETEIPRIGSVTANSTNQVRKRYFIYPGELSRDEFDQSSLPSLQRKSFRFSRALQTSANFQIGKLLRPLAVNAYVYDKDKALVQHERKVIEMEMDAEGVIGE